MNNLGISVGSVHKIITDKNKDASITYLKFLNLDIAGIEIVLAKTDFNNFELSNCNIQWLKSLSHVSYHLDINLPRCGFIEKYDDLINYYIWHNDYKLNLLDIKLEEYKDIKHKFLLENLDSSSIAFYYNMHPSINSVCCDIGHCLSYGMDYFCNFVFGNKDMIKMFHISNYKDGECHVPFYNDKENKLKEVKKILKQYNLLDKFFIMEYNFNNEKELISEFEYIENVFERYI